MPALVLRLVLSTLGLALVTGAQAATTFNGQINATLTLTSSCLVNGGAGATNLNFGTLNFGTTTSLFTQANTQLVASGGGAVSVLCSKGTTPKVIIKNGLYDGKSTGGSRALYDGVANYAPYDLYTDSGYRNILPANGEIPLTASTGEAQTFNLYGKAMGKDKLPAGTYTDTIAVQLSF